VVNELTDLNPLLAINEIVLKKKMISMKEHYDLEDRNGMKLGEAEGNLFQFPARFVIKNKIYSPKVRSNFSLTLI
jgi:uncharacterized protein YxjI